jgi:D-sedoheptulose 7-phosphate isomerase
MARVSLAERCGHVDDSAAAALSLVRDRLQERISGMQRMLDADFLVQVIGVSAAIAQALARGHKVVFFGNGGSAVDSSHLAAEFVNKIERYREPMAAISLTDNTAALTGIANDFGYTEVFARQLAALGREGDVAVGLTTSGHSTNVLRGLAAGAKLGIVSVAMVGEHAPVDFDELDFCLRMPGRGPCDVQEATMHLGHTICAIVERQLSDLP